MLGGHGGRGPDKGKRQMLGVHKVVWAALLASTVGVSGAAAQIPGLPKPPSAPAATPAAPPAAAPQEAAPQEGPPAVDSHFCPMSFFTDGNDTLRLRGASGAGCFDTGHGRDVLRLEPGDFPEGVTIISGRGRSILVGPNSPTEVFDQEASAEEIRTGAANDTVRVGLGFVEGAVVNTPRTEIHTGGGEDMVVVGAGLRPVFAARLGANTVVVPAPGTLGIEAGCGRPMDAGTVDITVAQAPVDSRVFVAARGCGVALRDHAAPTVLDQVGGRTAVQLGVPEGTVRTDAQIARSAGLGWSVRNPSADSRLEWSGFGTAALDVAAEASGTGGAYTLTGDSTVFARVGVGAGTPVLDLLSTERVEVEIDGLGPGLVRVGVAAPEMAVVWRPSATATPPEITFSPGGPVDAQPYQVKVLRQLWRPGLASASALASAEVAADSPPKDAPAPEGETNNGAAVASAPLQVRDALGRTEAAHTALLGGYAVGTVVPEGAEVQDWIIEPVFAAPGRARVVLAAPQGWCTFVRIEAQEGRVELPCGSESEAVVPVDGRVFVVDGEGTQEWPISGLDHPTRVVIATQPR